LIAAISIQKLAKYLQYYIFGVSGEAKP